MDRIIGVSQSNSVLADSVIYILFFKGMEMDIRDIGTYIPLSPATNGIEVVKVPLRPQAF